MSKKHSILIGFTTALVLLVIATFYYPGGSQRDPNSIGYDWKNNYLSNLFSPKAVNGLDNLSRPWAVAGIFFLTTSFALFFYQSSKKIPLKGAANVVKYVGVISMLSAFLVVTPLHDLMVIISGTGALVGMFYITVFLFKTKLLFMKIFSVVCLLIFYSCNFVYSTRIYLEFLPIMQKTLLVAMISWVLCLEYFTTKEDFQTNSSSKLNPSAK